MNSATTLLDRRPESEAGPGIIAGHGIIDCDIHPYPKSATALYPYLPLRWQQHIAAYGGSLHGPHASTGAYPLYSPNTSRRDAWPPGGGLPGSDLVFMCHQHLDRNNIGHGVLLPLFGGSSSRELELSAALCSAINEWQLAEFVSKENRLQASIQIPQDDDADVVEIERHAGNPVARRSSMGPAPVSRSAANATGRSSRPRNVSGYRSACMSAGPRAIRGPAAVGRRSTMKRITT